MDQKLLNIGCGSVYNQAWINLDIFPVDENVKYYNLKNRLPFGSSSIDAIYSSHALEHINKEQGRSFIKECFRVLKPGGVIRLAVPDLEKICQAYLDNLGKALDNEQEQYILNYQWNKIELIDQMVRQKRGGDFFKIISNDPKNKEYIKARIGQEFTVGKNTKEKLFFRLQYLLSLLIRLKFSRFLLILFNTIKSRFLSLAGEKHLWAYDRLDLKLLLESSGFKNFSIKSFSESNILNWGYYKLDTNDSNNGPRKPDSIFVEAEK